MSKRRPLWRPQPGGITVGTQIRFRPDRSGEGVVLVKSVCRGRSRRMGRRGEGLPSARPCSGCHLCRISPYNNHIKYIQLLSAFCTGN